MSETRDHDEPSLDERHAASLERKLAAALATIATLRTACIPLFTITANLRNGTLRDSTPCTLTLGQCRAITAAFPPTPEPPC